MKPQWCHPWPDCLHSLGTYWLVVYTCFKWPHNQWSTEDPTVNHHLNSSKTGFFLVAANSETKYILYYLERILYLKVHLEISRDSHDCLCFLSATTPWSLNFIHSIEKYVLWKKNTVLSISKFKSPFKYFITHPTVLFIAKHCYSHFLNLHLLYSILASSSHTTFYVLSFALLFGLWSLNAFYLVVIYLTTFINKINWIV